MVKVLIAVLAVFAFFGSVVPVGAGEAVRTGSVKELQLRKQFDIEARDRLNNLRQKKEENQSKVRTRLQYLADEKKAQIAENVSGKLCDAHAKRVEKLQEHLQKMSEILDRVEGKTNDLAAGGTDVTSVRKEIAEARTAVEAGRSAVLAFAGRDCGLNVSGTESSLGAELSNAIKNLETQFKGLQTKLTEARKATAEAIRAVAKLNNEVVN